MDRVQQDLKGWDSGQKTAGWPQKLFCCIGGEWGSGWTRALTAMFILQKAGEGQGIHEKAGQGLLGTLLSSLLWQNI